ncbi:hypothetical protein [Faecalibacter sp. LW9]|uniref:hypothetical protein n=1 Tax=Faecalibacter sp. LW9 TaxID=3103144 RepID=UPI003A4C51AD
MQKTGKKENNNLNKIKMAYNRKNYLLRVLEIQNITLENTRLGMYQKEVYYKLIEKQYLISFKTFCNYLSVNARKELKELEQKESLQNA